MAHIQNCVLRKAEENERRQARKLRSTHIETYFRQTVYEEFEFYAYGMVGMLTNRHKKEDLFFLNNSGEKVIFSNSVMSVK